MPRHYGERPNIAELIAQQRQQARPVDPKMMELMPFGQATRGGLSDQLFGIAAQQGLPQTQAPQGAELSLLLVADFFNQNPALKQEFIKHLMRQGMVPQQATEVSPQVPAPTMPRSQ